MESGRWREKRKIGGKFRGERRGEERRKEGWRKEGRNKEN